MPERTSPSGLLGVGSQDENGTLDSAVSSLSERCPGSGGPGAAGFSVESRQTTDRHGARRGTDPFEALPRGRTLHEEDPGGGLVAAVGGISPRVLTTGEGWHWTSSRGKGHG